MTITSSIYLGILLLSIIKFLKFGITYDIIIIVILVIVVILLNKVLENKDNSFGLGDSSAK